MGGKNNEEIELFCIFDYYCILSGISAVAAGDADVALNAEDNYQTNIESNQDLTYNAICESCDEKLNQDKRRICKFHSVL